MFASSALLASESRGPADDFWYTAIGTPSVTGARVNGVTALQLSTVYKCVRAKAETGSMLPLPVYRRLPRGKERAPEHWLSTLLQQPNPWQTGMQWREMMLAHTELRGNGYSHIRWNMRTGQADRLTPLHPDRVKLEVLDSGLPRYRYTDPQGREQVYVFGEILHLQGFSVDGYEGVNPIQAHREAFGAAIVARDYGARYFANSARPPTWLEAPTKFKDDVARRQWVADFKAAYGGRNAGTTPVLENGMKLHALPVNNSDAQWLEATNASALDICGLFRVPPHKVGILSEAKWANIEHQQIDWVTDAIAPNCVRLEQAIQRDLLLFDEEYVAEHLIDMLLRGDTKTRYEAYGKGIQDGWLLRNEAREKENLNPIEGLDTPLEPMNMAPAGSRGTAQQRGQPPDARALAIQTAAAERVARKECAAVQKALKAENSALSLNSFYNDHARFVSSVMAVPLDVAHRYCDQTMAHLCDALAGQTELPVDEFVIRQVQALLALEP
jgi:HK97 family phage portal protein